MMPGGQGWGIPVTALTPVTELMTSHKAFFHGKIHQVMIRRGWEREVKIRELEALPHVSCLALLCSERINATLHFFFLLW